jgi:hypothetical protein
VDVPAILAANEIPSMDVIGVTVVIVVPSVAGYFLVVRPESRPERCMRRVDSAIYDCDYYRLPGRLAS